MSESTVPRPITASNVSEPIMANPLSRPNAVTRGVHLLGVEHAVDKGFAGRLSWTRSRVGGEQSTRMFSVSSRSQTERARPSASQKRDSR